MAGEKSSNKWWNESITDLKVALRLYKNNFKAFFSSQILGFVVFGLVLFTITPILSILSGGNQISTITPVTNPQILVLTIITSSPAIVVLFAFFSCLFGLSYDIMTSGDEFAETKGTLRCFKKYWKQYFFFSAWIFFFGSCFSVIVILFVLALQPGLIGSNPSALGWLIAITDFIAFAWLLCFVHTVPSVTYQGRIKVAFKENAMIVKSNAQRAVASLLLYFLIFEAPLRVMNLITRSMVLSIENAPVYSFVLILSAIAAVVYYLMGFPVLSLICTRIYNTKILHGGDQHPDTR